MNNITLSAFWTVCNCKVQNSLSILKINFKKHIFRVVLQVPCSELVLEQTRFKVRNFLGSSKGSNFSLGGQI